MRVIAAISIEIFREHLRRHPGTVSGRSSSEFHGITPLCPSIHDQRQVTEQAQPNSIADS
jgi:hypothetical protein